MSRTPGLVRLVSAAVLVTTVALAMSGCVLVPGPGYYGPAVVAPAPAVIVPAPPVYYGHRGYGYWGHRHW